MKKIILFALMSAVIFNACKKSAPNVMTHIFKSSFEFEKKIKRYVKDKKKRDKTLLIITNNRIILKELYFDYIEVQRKVRNDSKISSNELRKIMNGFSKRMGKTLRRIARNRLEIRKHVTEAQWNKIFKKHKKKMKKKKKKEERK